MIPDHYSRVLVACTARATGPGPRRLPDRRDAQGAIAAVQVGTQEDADHVLRELDAPGRHIYVDVEAKQDIDLLQAARRLVTQGSVHTVKPNDSTVDATEAMVLHHYGDSLDGLRCAVYGTGNLAFKIALRLAERRADVEVHGRTAERVSATVTALNAILPRYTSPVRPGSMQSTLDLVVTAVTGRAVIGEEWLDLLQPPALVVDVGIDNLAAGFIEQVHRRGHACVRLDVRAAPFPVAPLQNRFFEEVMGRREIDGVGVVAGGLIGAPGEVIVDAVARPSGVIGVANGTGGLLPAASWSAEQREAVARVAALIG